MKRKIIYILIMMSAIVLSSCGAAKKSSPIKWQTKLDNAMKLAKSKNQIIMIDVYTEWCTWCKELDEKTYTQKDVVTLTKKMVSLKINPETSEDGAMLAQKYGVTGFPTILFINADGLLLNRVGGYVEGTNFIPYMEKAISEKERVDNILKEKEPTMDKLNLYLESGDLDNATKIYEELNNKKLISENEMPTILLGFGLNYAQRQDYENSKKYFNDIITKYPNSDERAMAEYYLAVTMMVEGKIDEAKKFIDEKIKSKDTSEELKKEYQNLIGYLEENAEKK